MTLVECVVQCNLGHLLVENKFIVVTNVTKRLFHIDGCNYETICSINRRVDLARETVRLCITRASCTVAALIAQSRNGEEMWE